MYSPQFIISPELLNNISKIEACKAVIENSPLLPLYERQFRTEATVRKVHFSTAIEGNYLKLDEVRRVISQNDEIATIDINDNAGYTKRIQDESGVDVVARRRDLHEVINYRNVVKYIEQLSQSYTKDNTSDFNLTENVIREIHEIILKNILDESGGKYREATAMSVNFITGERVYPYENFENIPGKIVDLLDWYNNIEQKRVIHPIIRAGLLHLEMVRIHPFEEGNGRLARALATLSLSIDGYDVNHFFCLDEYYDSNAQDYYDSLGKGFNEINIWLEYFSLGMAIEFNRIKERIVKISKDAKVKERAGQVFVTERQEKIIEWLNNYGYFRNQDFESLFPGISDDTVLRELKGLIDNEIIVKAGKTKSARYELV